ncbi:MAG TPA: hypothetical protein VKZ56_01200, partial [Membranihabitans sp.]|nr:hypothetical protein [Membranihabitans sp.]
FCRTEETKPSIGQAYVRFSVMKVRQKGSRHKWDEHMNWSTNVRKPIWLSMFLNIYFRQVRAQ